LHLIDANVLITAKNQYYPFEGVPEFWDWLAHMGTEGAIKMPLEIIEEIVGGEDDLAKWVSEKSIREALCLDEEVDLGLVQQVMNHYAPDLNDAEIIAIGRDPFLIAYGMKDRTQRVIVTVEASKPTCQRANRRIPDLCNDLGLSWCDSFRMTRDLNFSTKWKLAPGA
jgi:Domain of unknown function (DUF4411)